MLKKLSFAAILLLFFSLALQAEKKEYQVCAVGFYNLENLFDTIDQPDVRDEEYTPDGEKRYTAKVYKEKLHNLSTVISQLGTELSPDGLALLGVSEIENKGVLEDLAKQPKIADRNYQIVHYDSPDKRGVDVALLYQEKYFQPTYSKALNVPLIKENGDTGYTRDILWVHGKLNNDPVHVFVNHWPSRYGGQKASNYLREKAASVAAHVIDSLMEENPETKILLMGDLNDDPINSSVTKVLGAKNVEKRIKEGELFNPWVASYKKGIGTLAWRDAWNLFDQIILSSEFLDRDDTGLFFYKAEIFNKSFLIRSEGRYKGYPLRTYGGNEYLGGYSDHFPVMVYLLKEAE